MGDSRIPPLAGLLLGVLLLSSCSDPDTEKVRHLERGNQYAAEKRDKFAVIEYSSAVKLDPKFGEARFKLAQTYERMNNLRAAFPEYVRAADSLPDHREAQIKATQMLLLAGRFEDAKARAAALLAKDPKNVEALLLHANAMAALRDPAGAIAQIEEALKVSPDSSQAFVNLGAVRMQAGAAKEAEAAFRQAVALEPSSVDARLALANFLWAAGRMPEAEATVKEALGQGSSAPSCQPHAERAVPRDRANQGGRAAPQVRGRHLQSACRPFSVGRLLRERGRTKDAASLLTSLSADRATFAEAEARLAALDYAEGRVAEAHKRLDALLTRVPNHSQRSR